MRIEAQKLHILDAGEDVLAKWVADNREPKFRAKQIREWIFNRLELRPEKMSSLPAPLRTKLAEAFVFMSSSVLEAQESDGTSKLLVGLADSSRVECVIIPSQDRTAFCLSTQVGCPVRCRFCASGAEGFVRNLEYYEILEQFYHCCNSSDGRPDNIVFMGVGEPLANFANFMRAVRTLCSPDGIGMSPRKITVSTSGFVPAMRKLAAEDLSLNLAVSLHAPDDETRRKLIPDKFRWPVEEIARECIHYLKTTGRIVTLEYVLIAGINDSLSHARRLAEFARRCRAKVNLIAYNESGSAGFKAPTSASLNKFKQAVADGGAACTCRASRGGGINAACGQLRSGRA